MRQRKWRQSWRRREMAASGENGGVMMAMLAAKSA
jgi:hypothetical protein